MITPEVKDRALEKLIESFLAKKSRVFTISIVSLAKYLDTSADIAEALIEHFKDLNILDLYVVTNDHWQITLKVELFDLQRMGGFTSIEKNAADELRKLELELIALRSEIGQNKFDKVMGSIQLLSTWLKTFVSV